MYFVYNKLWHQKKSTSTKIFSRFLLFFLVLAGLYFLYFAIYGNRGYLALTQLSKTYGEKNDQFSALKKKENKLEDSLLLLDGELLDLDFLEERARIILNYSKKDEAIIDFH